MTEFLKTIVAFCLAFACSCAQADSDISKPYGHKSPPSAVITQQEITVGKLSGLHVSVGSNSPVILIVPGSGPTNRDGNNPQGISANTYKHLAEQLAQRGVSTVRVDKRGMFTSAGAGDPNAVTVDIYADDYRTWIDAIRRKTGAPCVYLLGHSEGALMVSAAAIGRSDVCGLILVSGVGRPFGDVLREQLQANPANAPILEQAFSAIGDLEAGKRVDATRLHPAIRGLFADQVQGFLISLFSIDPAMLAKDAGQRTLVVQGSTDLQTSLVDAELLADATGVNPVILDGVNHVLKLAPLDRAENFATYSNPNLPVAKSAVDAIESFVEVN